MTRRGAWGRWCGVDTSSPSLLQRQHPGAEDAKWAIIFRQRRRCSRALTRSASRLASCARAACRRRPTRGAGGVAFPLLPRFENGLLMCLRASVESSPSMAKDRGRPPPPDGRPDHSPLWISEDHRGPQRTERERHAVHAGRRSATPFWICRSGPSAQCALCLSSSSSSSYRPSPPCRRWRPT